MRCSVDGVCSMCGWRGHLTGGNLLTVGRDFLCGGCRTSLVHQAEACVLLDEYAREAMTLDELVEEPPFVGLTVLFIGRAGPIRKRLGALPGYSECHYEPDGDTREPRSGRVTIQDHQAFDFDDERFDLLVSSHVLEHVPDPTRAFAEARRILKPGGRYVFSVPTRFPLPVQTVVRAEVRAGEVHHLVPPRYHTSPEGDPSLVFHDFGHDVVDMMKAVGLEATIRRPHRSIQLAEYNVVFVARRSAGGSP